MHDSAIPLRSMARPLLTLVCLGFGASLTFGLFIALLVAALAGLANLVG